MGYNFKFTDLQAAVALPQLDEIEKRLAGRAAARPLLCRAPRQPAGARRSPSAIEEPGEVRQWTDVLIEHRDAVSAALDDQDRHRAFWFPLHRQAPYQRDGAPFANLVQHLRTGPVAAVAFQPDRKRRPASFSRRCQIRAQTRLDRRCSPTCSRRCVARRSSFRSAPVRRSATSSLRHSTQWDRAGRRRSRRPQWHDAATSFVCAARAPHRLRAQSGGGEQTHDQDNRLAEKRRLPATLQAGGVPPLRRVA